MKEATARALVDLLLRHGAELDAALGPVKADEPDEEFRRIRTMIAQRMGRSGPTPSARSSPNIPH